ncbi:hypothetical protein [Bacillus infantis]|uniref:hypothetical protein n=1 Tax=Bacillus infantis TaxID=324767 RepID=UPI003CEEABD9
MSIESLFERQGRCEEKLTGHDRRLESLETDNKALLRLATVVEMQAEANREQQETSKSQHQTLQKINENLTGLNTKMENLDSRVEQLESNDSERKLDFGKLFRDLVYKVVPAIAIAYFLFKMGLQ